MSSPHPTIVSETDLRQFCELALTRAGVSEVDAQTISDALVETDLLGVHTHGVKLLRDYVRRLMAGGSKSQTRPCIDRQGPAWAVVDGQDAMGHVAGAFAMKLAIEKANTCGIAYVGVHHTGHFGAAGYYATLAARRGLIGIAMCNDIPSVAAPVLERRCSVRIHWPMPYRPVVNRSSWIWLPAPLQVERCMRRINVASPFPTIGSSAPMAYRRPMEASIQRMHLWRPWPVTKVTASLC